jgi:hypothetical protein
MGLLYLIRIVFFDINFILERVSIHLLKIFNKKIVPLFESRLVDICLVSKIKYQD